MGVLGLAPFIQKAYPEVVRILPKRLRELGGKTIVIDGTLVTQRLHFAPAPHPYRHVLGWYRLVHELRESNVKAICVFDGRERSAAKQREIERRREVRRIDSARASIEVDRLRRLRRLRGLLNSTDAIPQDHRRRVVEALKKLAASREPPEAALSLAHLDEDSLTRDEVLDALYDSVPSPSTITTSLAELRLEPARPVATTADSSTEALPSSTASPSEGPPLHEEESHHNEHGHVIDNATTSFWIPDEWDHPPDLPLTTSEAAYSEQVSAHLAAQPQNPSWFDAEPTTTELDDILTAFASLYLDYRASLPKLRSASSSPSLTASQTSAEEEEAHASYSMSKNQAQLAVEEGKLWDSLSQEDVAERAEVERDLEKLRDKSQTISESYKRRANPPTTDTYDQCKEIIQAMGLACVETSGPFEAEALASALVLNGRADYVASEDTDVLVYEAPLLRNITSRNAPLTLLHGSHIRSALSLSRSSYIDFALLLGTDFSPRIKNVGPARALRFIKQHDSIENILSKETSFPPRMPTPEYLSQVALARAVFETLPPVPGDDVLKGGEADEEKVAGILGRYGLGREVMPEVDYEYTDALAGNYFGDDPTASNPAC